MTRFRCANFTLRQSSSPTYLRIQNMLVCRPGTFSMSFLELIRGIMHMYANRVDHMSGATPGPILTDGSDFGFWHLRSFDTPSRDSITSNLEHATLSCNPTGARARCCITAWQHSPHEGSPITVLSRHPRSSRCAPIFHISHK